MAKNLLVFFEAGMAQHHINGDIAHAIILYYNQTQDYDLLFNGGFEVLVETARLYTEIADERNGEYHFDKITGPDEYSVLVNDNYYTNKLISHQTQTIVELSEVLANFDPQRWQQLQKKLAISTEEISEFEEIGMNLALPFDEERGIIAQDRDFLNKGYWPIPEAETKHPLLLHYHPLMIYRYQICKQADAVLALMLFDEDFDLATIQRSVTYYDQITTHDSSLSYSIFSIVYARLGQTEKAFDYFLKNALIDLDDTHGNTKDGIHAASIAGTYLTIMNGFFNLRFKDGKPEIHGELPEGIEGIACKIKYLGNLYKLEIDSEGSQVSLVME